MSSEAYDSTCTGLDSLERIVWEIEIVYGSSSFYRLIFPRCNAMCLHDGLTIQLTRKVEEKSAKSVQFDSAVEYSM